MVWGLGLSFRVYVDLGVSMKIFLDILSRVWGVGLGFRDGGLGIRILGSWLQGVAFNSMSRHRSVYGWFRDNKIGLGFRDAEPVLLAAVF